MTSKDHSNPVPELSQVNTAKESRVTIIRTPHDDERPFFAMARSTAQDRALSWEARGVLAYLLSKPSDWQIIIADLKQNCGRDKVRNILDELKLHGYLVITQGHDEKGHFTAEYKLYETPITEKPSTVNQKTVKPDTAKRLLHKIDKQTTEKNPSRKRDEMFDAIVETFGITAGGWVGNLKNMMLGTAKRGEWARCNFNPPVTDPAEIRAFKPYMERRKKEKNISGEITACVTIQRWFYDFRNERDNPKNVISVLDGLVLVS